MWKTQPKATKTAAALNTIDRCFREAQDILSEASQSGGERGITYAVFSALQPTLTQASPDQRIALVAWAIWNVRRTS